MSSDQTVGEGGSPLNALNARIAWLKRQGKPVIELHVGQPHEPLPGFLQASTMEALQDLACGEYTLVEGNWEVRESLGQFALRMFGLNYAPERIVFTSGAKQGIGLSIKTILSADGKCGSKIMVIASDWPTYAAFIKEQGGEIVLLKSNEDFSLPVGEIKRLMDDEVRAIIINSPNNPTGVIYDQAQLEELAQIALANNIFVISDEVYRANVLDGSLAPSIASITGMEALAFVVNSFSKMWAVPGWRAGFVLAPTPQLAAMIAAYKSNEDGNTCSLAQFAIKLAIDGHGAEALEFIAACNRKYRENASLICRQLELWGVDFVPPQGALYVFAKLASNLGMGSEELTARLLEAGVAVAPGAIFGPECDGYIRICVAADREEIESALCEIEKIINKNQGGNKK